MIKSIKNFFMGFVIGASMLVPGLSGGTIAIILGVYDDLIYSMSNLFSQFKKCIIFLLPIGLGGLVGAVSVAKLISKLIELWEIPMMYFFIGVVVGSLPTLIKRTKVKKVTLNSILWFLVGFGIIFLTTVLPTDLFTFNERFTASSVLLLLLAGIMIAIAFILPGISTSLMLLTLGIYEKVTKGIEPPNIDYAFLIPLAISTIIGVAVLVKILDVALKKHPNTMYLIITGFVAGSLIEIYPDLPQKNEILYSILMFIFGTVLIYLFSKYTSKKEEERNTNDEQVMEA